jgi:hypothetical protein
MKDKSVFFSNVGCASFLFYEGNKELISGFLGGNKVVAPMKVRS